MRMTLRSTLMFLICALPLSAQTAPQKPPKKGDTIIVRGCLRGNAVEQADVHDRGRGR